MATEDLDGWAVTAGSTANYFGIGTTVNVTSETPAPFYADYVHCRFLVGIWEIVLGITGTPMNALIILMAMTIMTRTGVQENQHVCIISMAIADFLFTSLHCSLMFVNYTLQIDLSFPVCKLLYFVTHLATVASSLSLLCLNIDKYTSLRCPLRYYSLLTYRRMKICILIAWLLSIIWAITFVFGPLTAFRAHCEVFTVEPYSYSLFTVLFFALPVIGSLIISLYILTVAVGARRAEYCQISNGQPSQNRLTSKRPPEGDYLKPTQNCDDNNGDSSRNSSIAVDPSVAEGSVANRKPVSKRKTVTFVFCTSVWSALTFIPYRAAYLFYYFYDGNTVLTKFSFLLFALMVSNATGNPFITVVTQCQYRAKLKNLFFKQQHSDTSSLGENYESKPKRMAMLLALLGNKR